MMNFVRLRIPGGLTHQSLRSAWALKRRSCSWRRCGRRERDVLLDRGDLGPRVCSHSADIVAIDEGCARRDIVDGPGLVSVLFL